MSGYPQFNFPAFAAAAEVLRHAGYEVVSPAEQDSPEVQAAALASKDGTHTNVHTGDNTYGSLLARCVHTLVDGVERQWTDSSDPAFSASRLPIDGIIFLEGWQKSKGAKLEAFVGVLDKKDFATLDMLHDEAIVTPRSLGWVMHQLATQYADEIAIHLPLPGAA